MNIDELIYKYLRGNLNLEEQHRLNSLLEQHHVSPKGLKKIDLFWNDPKNKFGKESDEVYKDIFKKIEETQKKEITENKFRESRRNTFRYLS
ncbi:MAG: hypothetical protein RID25_00325, partial [Cyclobacteriaceae bacterium]